MSTRRKYLIAGLIVLFWASTMLAAFWWFEARYLRTFEGERAELFSGDALQLPAALQGPGPVRFVHFWDPGCPCNVGNQRHLQELLENFADQPVEFFEVRKPGSTGRLPQQLAALKSLPGIAGSELLPASPAVGIWDSNGQLAYIGPYSEGAVCSSDNSFVEPILEALLAGRPVRATHSLAVACFCDWQR
ncbi:DUF6436 domain-containing protein [Pseudomonas saudiphocaensis]|uniref:DUF6436 domain-containing protein n=1 Tax=Pseudomonas saudiphocaensis TaxID=1499686 RepID=UPI000F79928E|nr:DUF6436 domain-containing protein [Pseudomonas saudiphocaensis]MBE7926221.1 thiol-disulfide isomerase [Pseudomonas saudiphocaensis]RRV17235.1 thiol-disulfide isomerase [Pseudomonas saudiphocaensis]